MVVKCYQRMLKLNASLIRWDRIIENVLRQPNTNGILHGIDSESNYNIRLSPRSTGGSLNVPVHISKSKIK